MEKRSKSVFILTAVFTMFIIPIFNYIIEPVFDPYRELLDDKLHGKEEKENVNTIKFETHSKLTDKELLHALKEVKQDQYSYLVTQKKYEELFNLFYQLANNGDKESMYYLGRLYMEAKGTYKDLAKSEFWLKRSNNKDHRVLLALGNLYKSKKDYILSIKYYTQAMETGSKKAINELGILYYYGYGVQKNTKKAIYFFKKGEDLNDIASINNLGYCYLKGIGIKKDVNKAIYYLKKAGNLGSSYSLFNLACLYKFGLGINKDYKLAIYYLKKSADLGNTKAMIYLGGYYLKTQNQKRNGFQYFLRAANLGNKNAINNLGYCYEFGLGTKKDIKKAIFHYKLAAKLESITAMINLGFLYQKGQKIKKDLKISIFYFQKAAKLGDTRSINILKRLAKDDIPEALQSLKEIDQS